MNKINGNVDLYRLKDFASAFSRTAFSDVLNYDDYSRFDWIVSKYRAVEGVTYFDMLKKIYRVLSKEYCCEYVYKNELISRLLHDIGTRDTVYFNEFRVGTSIADMVVFNGESKAFEIKTEYDTPRRLTKQMAEYGRFFDKCYLVVPESKLDRYAAAIESGTGIIVMRRLNGRLILDLVKDAEQNQAFDSLALMSCLRTAEYVNIATCLGGDVTGVPRYRLYEYCQQVIQNANEKLVRACFLREVKKRKNSTSQLRGCPMPLKQMLLSLNLGKRQQAILLNKLNVNVNAV